MLPAALTSQGHSVGQSVAAVKAAGGKSATGKKLLDRLTKLTDELKQQDEALQSALAHEGHATASAHAEALP